MEEKNFATLLDMIDASEVREDDENYKNPIDRLFETDYLKHWKRKSRHTLQ